MANVDLNVRVGVTPKNPFDDILDSVDMLKDQFSGLTSGFAKVSGAIAAVSAVAGSFDFILDATRQMEDLTAQFVRFTGSTEAAEDQLRALADIPGPDLETLAEANRTLLAFGVSTGKSIEQLKQLNDVAAASGTKINDLADIFGKIQEDGKLTAATYAKLTKQVAGFSTDFADALGIPQAAFKELAQAGEISAAQINTALKKLTGEGGKLFGSAEKQAQTFSGSIDDLQDNITALAAEIGKSLIPSLVQSSNIFSEFAKKITDVLSEQRKIASDETLTRIGKLSQQIEDSSDRLKTFNSIANMSEGIGKKLASFPFGGAEGVASLIEKTTQKLKELNAERSKLSEQKGAEQFAQTMAKLADDQQKQADKAADQALEKLRESQKKQLEEIAKGAKARSDAEKAAQQSINKIVEQEAAVRAQIMREQQEQILQDQKQAAEKAALEAQIAAQGRLTLNQTIAAQESVFALEQAQLADDMLTAQRLESLQTREQELTAARIEAEAARLELLGQFDEAEILRAQAKNQKLLEVQKKAEADRLKVIQKAKDDEFNFSKINAEQEKKFQEATLLGRLQMISNGLDAFASLSRSKNRELATIGKAAAIAQTAFAIPQAAQQAYTAFAFFPPLAIAAAAAATIAGLERLNTIRQTPIGFATGGEVPGTGNKDTVLSLLTPGEVVVPQKNFEDMQALIEGGGSNQDTVNLIRQSNALLERILNEIQFGIQVEKLTTVISVLQKIDNGIGGVAAAVAAGNSDSNANIDKTKNQIAEINRNRPATIDRRDLQQVRDNGTR